MAGAECAKEKAILSRFSALIQEGEGVHSRFTSELDTASGESRVATVAWLYSAINLIEIATPVGSPYNREATPLRPSPTGTIFGERVAAVLGLLRSAHAEFSAGLLLSLEAHFVGLAFEDFLSHASIYQQQGKVIESAVLASAVFEDTIKRLCRRNGIDVEGKTLDPSINILAQSNVIGRVTAQRLRAYAAVRNKAAHAEWEAIDDRSLQQMIEGLEGLLETHFK
jgi:uncharacterized protein YutE (UPF0331/DUF86 family)